MPAFGFSVGDFIAAIELCNKIAKALKDTDGASSDFINVAIELHSLENVLRRVAALEPNASNIEHVDAIRGLALSCLIPVKDFLAKLRTYESALGPVPTRKFQAGRKLKWAFQMVEEVNKMRDLVAARKDSINLRLAMHSSEALSRIEAQSLEQHDVVLTRFGTQQQDFGRLSTKIDATKAVLAEDISAASKSLQQGIEDVAHETSGTKQSVVSLTTAFATFQTSLMSLKSVCFEMLVILQRLPIELVSMLRDIRQSNMQMYSLLLQIASSVPASPTSLLTSNIRFEDALGVIMELPYEYFKHWEVFESMLCCKFKDRPGERKIRSGQYLILNSRMPGVTVSKDEWDLAVQPGTHLQMSIGLVRSYNKNTSCPRPGCAGKTISTQDQPSKEGETLKCEQCGLTSRRYPEQPGNFPVRLPRLWSTIEINTPSRRRPRNPPKSLENEEHLFPHESLVFKASDVRLRYRNRLDRIARSKIKMFRTVITALVCFSRILSRLRRREERELRAFKAVHIKHSATQSATPESTNDPHQWTWTVAEIEEYDRMQWGGKLRGMTVPESFSPPHRFPV